MTGSELTRNGFNHVDLVTRDMSATRHFYESVLGFPLVRYDVIERDSGGRTEHVFFDAGYGQMIAFMQSSAFDPDMDTSINGAFGFAMGIYHFAFEARSIDELDAIKKHLESHQIEVKGPEEHEGWSKSIYFADPNGLQLEYCCILRPFTEEDAEPKVRFRISREGNKIPA